MLGAEGRPGVAEEGEGAASSPARTRHHTVQFYDDDRFLADVVGDFLAAGMAAGEPMVVIATPAHRDAFRDRLVDRGLDVDGAIARGRLTLLDARETLAAFMVEGVPDRSLFLRAVTAVLDAALVAGGGAHVRAYGEMVDLLWREGNAAAALRLEALWNELCDRRPFSLLCAYAMSTFRDGAHRRQFAEVCHVHSHARPTERFAELEDEDARLREVALLQERAQALEAEIERRKQIERELRESLSVRDDFLSVAGHELRTPLTALQLHLGSLVRSAKQTGALDVIERAGKAVRQTSRLASLVDRLLDVSRLSAGRLALEPESLDLAALARDVVDRLADISAQAGCDVRVVGSDAVVGHWDRVRLEEVVENLLSNALKHARGSAVDVVVTRLDAGARLEVQDRGRGIATDDQARIFERFERTDAAQNVGGLGLGLWIARKIVEAHGGTIAVDSAPGTGATFTVVLPC